ncbi:hypothetical protein BDP27DRAFT_1316564 [Rhodocollybia butyracea]|uniref:Uncharacterized protein n=1 Tax=Rhodocollybia butyracea TaxID=206335 RepID=A0A9P5PXX8_9AGAR|nr:hypothetical protein BDP27DRAFT_1316564 [Rhodocollybia butyracea]
MDQSPTQLSCRRCQASFETPEHVLLQCLGIPELVAVRNDFRTRGAVSIPDLHPRFVLSDGDAISLLKQAIFSWTAVSFTAKFVYKAIQIWSFTVTGGRVRYGSESEDSDPDVFS